MNDIVLFRCHNESKRTLENFNWLSGVCTNVVKVYDATGKEPLDNTFNVTLENIEKEGLPIASIEDLRRVAPKEYEINKKNEFSFNSWQKRMQMWYNPGHSIILYYLLNPDYDYYWSIEYDVYFNGNWKDFFSQFENDKSDFLGTALDDFNEKHFLWKLYEKQYDFKKPKVSFGIVQRYSRQLLEAVYEELKSGNFAYYEVLFPSVATEYNMTVNDLNCGKRKVYNDGQIMGDFPNSYIIRMTAGGENKLFHRCR